RMRARHKQAVLFRAAEGEIGAALRKVNESDRLALGIEHLYAVKSLALGIRRAVTAKTAPDVAVGIDADSVDSAGAVSVDQLGLVRQGDTVGPHFKRPDQPVRLCARFHDVELLFVRRECE